jgi:lysophospholipase L1-like esterase
MKILGFGDSLTAGTPGYEPGYGGDARSQYGFWLLDSARNDGVTTLQFHNQGIPGELARMMPQRLKRLLEANSYDLVIIMAGTNDLGWGFGPSDVYESLLRIWQVSTSRETTTIACSIPPIGMRVPHHQQMQQELNQRILQEGSRLPYLLVADVFSKLADDNGLLPMRFDSGDGLHLSVEGYRRIGESLWNDVVRNLV